MKTIYLLVKAIKKSEDIAAFGKNNNRDDALSFNEFNLKNRDKETTVGIKTDQKLTFNSYDKTSSTKAGQKLCALFKLSFDKLVLVILCFIF